MKLDISKHIFRAYDIRGLYEKDISPEEKIVSEDINLTKLAEIIIG